MSFAKQVKNELVKLESKIKKCCGYSFVYGLLFSAKAKNNDFFIKVDNNSSAEVINLLEHLGANKSSSVVFDGKNIKLDKSFMRYNHLNEIRANIFKCTRCHEYFLRGLFLSCGTVNDPNNSYRLEMTLNTLEQANDVSQLLLDIGLSPLLTKRREKFVIYFRKSESIEDFFANIGATNLAFDFMNSKINKELVNNANRITNCDSANINKSIKASEKYNTVITDLINTEKLDMLPDSLREMAQKRIEFKELSFSELGKKFVPAISKSGVYHRLEKILEFYNELKEKNIL